MGLASTLAAAQPVLEAPPARGVVQALRLTGDPEQRYFLYLPRSAPARARVLVSVHGISRNAREHAERFARYAEDYGVVVVAPLFTRARHPDYQRLGREGRGLRADRTLDRVLAEVARLTGADTERVYLFGYSGGGQFVHRYAMAHPRRVAAMAIGAAGWYTFPDQRRRYPQGLRPSERLPGVVLDPEAFLRIPACVLVGEHDLGRDLELNQRPAIDRRQGRTRVERGARWIEAMYQAARAQGYRTRYRFELLPDTDHSFTHGMRRGGMGRRVFRCLFGRLDRDNVVPLAGGERGGTP